MKALLITFAAPCALSGCMHIKIDEGDILRSDKVSGYVQKRRFDQQSAQQGPAGCSTKGRGCPRWLGAETGRAHHRAVGRKGIRVVFRRSYADGLRAVDNVRAVSQFQGRGLVIAGEEDDQVAHPLARQVFDAMPTRDKHYMLVPGGQRVNLLERDDVRQIYCAFIAEQAKAVQSQ